MEVNHTAVLVGEPASPVGMITPFVRGRDRIGRAVATGSGGPSDARAAAIALIRGRMDRVKQRIGLEACRFQKGNARAWQLMVEAVRSCGGNSTRFLFEKRRRGGGKKLISTGDSGIKSAFLQHAGLFT